MYIFINNFQKVSSSEIHKMYFQFLITNMIKQTYLKAYYIFNSFTVNDHIRW